jgi:hypothetical protein
VTNILFVPCPLAAQCEDSQRPKNLSGHSRIAPLTLRYVCVFFRVDAHGFGLCDLLLTSLACLSGASNFCGERQRRRCDGKTGPLRAYRIVLVHPGGSKILPRQGFYQVRRAKTNKAIGSNVFTICGGRRRTRPLPTTCYLCSPDGVRIAKSGYVLITAMPVSSCLQPPRTN